MSYIISYGTTRGREGRQNMDTAMRNLEQIQESEPDDGSSRRLGMLAMAALATVMLVFAMGTMLQAGAEDPAEAEDPLAALDRAAGMQLRAEDAPEEDVNVDARALRFHETLSASPSSADDRPEVEAALAAAAAELDALAVHAQLDGCDLVPGAGGQQ